MAERGAPDQIRVRPRSFMHWFKNRWPPSPTLQAGFSCWMLG